MNRFIINAIISLIPLLSCQDLTDGQGPEDRQIVSLSLVRLDVKIAAKKAKAVLGKDGDATVHVESNTLFLTGQPAKIERAIAIVRRLDARPPMQLCVIPLNNLDATKTVRSLRIVLYLLTLLSGDHGECTLIVDGKGNRMIVFANDDQLNQVKAMIRQLEWLRR